MLCVLDGVITYTDVGGSGGFGAEGQDHRGTVPLSLGVLQVKGP